MSVLGMEDSSRAGRSGSLMAAGGVSGDCEFAVTGCVSPASGFMCPPQGGQGPPPQ